MRDEFQRELMDPVELRQTRVDPGARRNPLILATAGLVIVAGLVLVVALASRFGVDPDYVASAVIDRDVPDLELPRLGAEGTISLRDLRGEILAINFWASWCPSCRAEHDDLMAAAAEYEPYGVRFIGVVFEDRPASARAMLDELGWGYEYVTDPGSRAAFAFGVRGVPETYFVDRRGVIVARISGESDITTLGNMIDGILFQSGLDSTATSAPPVTAGAIGTWHQRGY